MRGRWRGTLPRSSVSPAAASHSFSLATRTPTTHLPPSSLLLPLLSSLSQSRTHRAAAFPNASRHSVPRCWFLVFFNREKTRKFCCHSGCFPCARLLSLGQVVATGSAYRHSLRSSLSARPCFGQRVSDFLFPGTDTIVREVFSETKKRKDHNDGSNPFFHRPFQTRNVPFPHAHLSPSLSPNHAPSASTPTLLLPVTPPQLPQRPRNHPQRLRNKARPTRPSRAHRPQDG